MYHKPRDSGSAVADAARGVVSGMRGFTLSVAYVMCYVTPFMGATIPASLGRGADVQAEPVSEKLKVTSAAIAGRVMTVGQAILVAVIMLIVLGELYSTDIVANPTNPNVFTNLTTTFGDYGSVAFTMIGLGLIAAGAAAALAYFGAFNSGGR